ncbi:MAG: MCE family protein [Rhodococcus sp. (in: high G+C Gram-positive bacteria)]|uniref:MCE family protein n=1 Tax=Rhodococcus sp. TaxID=1831 RepID=UPI003BB20BC5
MKSFLERRPGPIGLIGTGVIAAVLVAAFNFESLPGVNDAVDYKARFADASGLHSGDDVEIAGVKVGKVTEIELAGTAVEVSFTADTDNAALGDATTAAIKVQTALGRRFIELESRGSGELDEGATIAIERTTAGFDITDSLSEVTRTVTETDVDKLSQALDVTGEMFSDLPPELQSSLDGLSRLSNTISSRDGELRQMATHANGVSGVLAERNQQLVALMGDGRALFAALNERAETIRTLLINVREVANQLSALADENRAAIGPTLAELETVTATLNSNYGNLNEALTRMAPFIRNLNEAVSSGPYFGVILQNILPADLRGQMPNSFGGGN